jgi:hypothetical protein
VWRAYTGVIHCVFAQIPNLQNCFTIPNKNQVGEGASDRYSPQTDKYLYWSIFEKSRHLGFGVFIDIWSMIATKQRAMYCVTFRRQWRLRWMGI